MTNLFPIIKIKDVFLIFKRQTKYIKLKLEKKKCNVNELLL